MLTSPVNISEGRDATVIARIARAAGGSLLDLHSDFHHHRTVLTLGGEDVPDAVRAVAAEAISMLDLAPHNGVHPRVGVLDVVPFVPYGRSPMTEALRARDEFAEWAGVELALPVFKYGPERSLPDIRRGAFSTISPDEGPTSPHPTAGACCVGARSALVAWNVWLAYESLTRAKAVVSELRRQMAGIRALALDVGGVAQVSCNLIEPLTTGPHQVYDFVSERAAVERCELVGLVPREVLRSIPQGRWPQLDLSVEQTLEFRLGG